MYIKIPIYIKTANYSHCPRANRMSALGTLLIGLGIFFSLSIVGAIIGVPLIICGVSNRKRAESVAAEEHFAYWMGYLQENGVLLHIPESKELAIEMYKKNPSVRTLEYLKLANPEAVKVIESGPVFSDGN